MIDCQRLARTYLSHKDLRMTSSTLSPCRISRGTSQEVPARIEKAGRSRTEVHSRWEKGAPFGTTESRALTRIFLDANGHDVCHSTATGKLQFLSSAQQALGYPISRRWRWFLTTLPESQCQRPSSRVRHSGLPGRLSRVALRRLAAGLRFVLNRCVRSLL